jgi:FKBP-type peptidyl-prolyl cis-trans isomerase FkpA
MRQEKNILFCILLSVIILIPLNSCNTKDYDNKESADIQFYINTHPQMNFELKQSGLYYYEVKAGHGLPVQTHDTAYAFFSLKFLDGTVLQSNFNTKDTLIFRVNEGIFIMGFDEGITYMSEGGESMLIVPSSLGYGSAGRADYIPGNTPLFFDIVLARIKRGPGPGKK